MKTFEVTGVMTAEVKILIDAEDANEASRIFVEHLKLETSIDYSDLEDGGCEGFEVGENAIRETTAESVEEKDVGRQLVKPPSWARP